MAEGLDESSLQSIVLEEGAILAGKYKLTRTAGFGGMAQLWVATNRATGAEVCIKILVPGASDDDSVERFRREAHAAARLSHRGIVRIFDLVELGPNGETTTTKKPTALAIVMELLAGETLGDYLMKKGKLSLDEAIDLTLPFLSALGHAHRAGVVHRDLKPDNIFLAIDPDGQVLPKVLDFGVSKMSAGEREAHAGDAKPLTLDGMMLGTPSFMSPEQARGARNIDARSDVFSSGILFYMMLAGNNPFQSESFHSVVSAIIQREPPRLVGLSDAVWAVLEKALAKDPNARYPNATDLGIALRIASGRTSSSASGVYSEPLIPLSARAITTPLGRTSVVTVPPVGNAELGDGPVQTDSEVSVPAARKRAVKIVVGVVGVAVAMLIASLFRTPEGSTSSASTTGATPVISATATATTTATASLLATAKEPDVVEAGATPATSTSVATPKPTPLPPPSRPVEKRPDPGPVGTYNEPAIVRDPGF